MIDFQKKGICEYARYKLFYLYTALFSVFYIIEKRNVQN